MARPGFLQVSANSLGELARTVNAGFVQLAKAFQQIEFDNFESFEVEVEVPASSEVRVANQFGRDKQPIIPRYMLVLSQTGSGIVVRGAATWTVDNLYIKNVTASTATVTVRFFR